MSFNQPAPSGQGIDYETHKGALLMVEPKALLTGVNTIHGIKDAVEADVHVIDGPGSPATYTGTYLFPVMLVSATRGMIGERCLGRLVQGPATGGHKPPWKLDEYSEADLLIATAWLKGQTQQPATVGAGQQSSRSFSDEPPF